MACVNKLNASKRSSSASIVQDGDSDLYMADETYSTLRSPQQTGDAGKKLRCEYSVAAEAENDIILSISYASIDGEVSGKGTIEPSWKVASREYSCGAIHQIRAPNNRSDGYSGEESRVPRKSGSYQRSCQVMRGKTKSMQTTESMHTSTAISNDCA